MFATACQSSDPEYTEDHTHFERIVGAVKALQSAYETRDLKAFQALQSTSADLDQLTRDMEKDFSTYATISLTLTIERISTQENQATVNVRWEGMWQRESDATPIRDRGHGVLVWSGRAVVLLERVEGNLPFGRANR
ncbi:MAG: hypothetical protein OXU40_00280 [Nitrospira sp.]|nr:hypothetical protein [Nitrospira sp.]